MGRGRSARPRAALGLRRQHDPGERAGLPQHPDRIPTSTPTVDLAFAYSGGQRVLKSATLQGTTTTHTLEILGSLRLEGTTFDGATDDYVRDRFTERVFLGGIGRVVYDANGALPSPSGTNQHVYLQMGDHLGSTSVTIDGETGEVVERTTFQAMGGVEGDYRPARWGAFREEYKFTGKEEDTEIGLVYFGARYYHPKLGRFASADPLTIHAAGADLNPYAYVGGQVMRAVDPFGLDCVVYDGAGGGGTSSSKLVVTGACKDPSGTPDRVSAATDRAGAAADKAFATGRALLDQLPGQRDTNKIIREAIKDKERTATPRGYGIGLARGLVRGVVDNTLVLQVAGADKTIIGALPATDPHDVAAAVGDEQGKNALTAAVTALTVGGAAGADAAKAAAGQVYEFSLVPAPRGNIILGTVRNGVLEFAVEAGPGAPVRGRALFAEMWKALGRYVTVIQGHWRFGTNLAEFNRLTAMGVPEEKAALQTWTGKVASEYGFKSASIVRLEGARGSYKSVTVHFRR